MYEIKYGEEWTDFFGLRDEIDSWVMAELTRAYYEARRAKRSTNDEQVFEMRAVENLLQLRDDILERNYRPSSGIAFIVHDPVMREIFAAPFRDRVIHHMLYNGVADWWDRRLIYDCYSCRVGKGTLFGIQRFAKHVRAATENYTKPAICLKMDIQGYFMSLPREGLYERICWGLDRQFPNKGPKYNIYKYLWREIIFDDPVNGVKKRGDLNAWNILPKSKSLFGQPPGKGIVIGNLSSQLLSNIYLDKLDRFVKFDLGYEHYGRYVDDFFIIVKPEELAKAKRDLVVIKDFLTKIGLTLHPKKTRIQEVAKGTPFLGMVIYPGRIVPGKRIIKNYQQALVKFEQGRLELDSLISYMGVLTHVNGARTQQKMFAKVGLEYNF